MFSQPPACPPLGSSASLPDPSLEKSSLSGLLIDVGNRAQCNGTMTAWDYCLHLPTRTTQYSATFMVFQRGMNENQFSAVPGSISKLRLNVSSDPDSASCGSLNLRDPIRIKEGDVVGACVVSNDEDVSVVSTGATTRPTEVYISQESKCRRNEIDISRNNFNLRNQLNLHLSARIGMQLVYYTCAPNCDFTV